MVTSGIGPLQIRRSKFGKVPDGLAACETSGAVEDDIKLAHGYKNIPSLMVSISRYPALLEKGRRCYTRLA